MDTAIRRNLWSITYGDFMSSISESNVLHGLSVPVAIELKQNIEDELREIGLTIIEETCEIPF